MWRKGQAFLAARPAPQRLCHSAAAGGGTAAGEPTQPVAEARAWLRHDDSPSVTIMVMTMTMTLTTMIMTMMTMMTAMVVMVMVTAFPLCPGP